MYCPSCGYKNEDSARFCTSCGNALQPQQAQVIAPPSPPTPPATGTAQEPGRGGLILAFGILSVVALGLIFGIPAWVMANRDMKKMKSGKMESDQRGMTLAGMVLGIVGTFISSGLILIILAVTSTVVTFNALKKGTSSENLAAVGSLEPGLAYYDNIGQIRGQTADEAPSVYLVRVSLGYDPADKQVDVEIGLREKEIEKLLLKYISQRTAAELSPAHYDDLQEGLRDVINTIMTTGKIRSVVFREFTVVK